MHTHTHTHTHVIPRKTSWLCVFVSSGLNQTLTTFQYGPNLQPFHPPTPPSPGATPLPITPPTTSRTIELSLTSIPINCQIKPLQIIWWFLCVCFYRFEAKREVSVSPKNHIMVRLSMSDPFMYCFLFLQQQPHDDGNTFTFVVLQFMTVNGDQ